MTVARFGYLPNHQLVSVTGIQIVYVTNAFEESSLLVTYYS